MELDKELLDKETWVDIVGYEGHYKVSNMGRVKSLDRYITRMNRPYPCKERILKPIPNPVGYLAVCLYLNDVSTRVYIHRLVCDTFLNNPEGKRTVNHKNGDITDNRLENLEYATYSENHIHAYNNLGRRNPNSKYIQQFTLDGTFVAEYPSARSAARTIGGSQGNISACCRGELVTSLGFKWKYKS